MLFVEFAAGADDNDNNYNDDTNTRANSELMMKMKILVVVAIMMTMTTKTITMMMMMVMMTMMMIMKMTRRFVLKGAGYNPMDVLNCLMTRRGYKVAINTIFFKTNFHLLLLYKVVPIPSFSKPIFIIFFIRECFQKGINDKMEKKHGGGAASNAIKY